MSLANDNSKFRPGMFLDYKGQTVVVDSGLTKLGVLVFYTYDPSNGFYAKVEDLSSNKKEYHELYNIPRSDLMQLKVSTEFKNIVDLIDGSIGTLGYFIEPLDCFHDPYIMKIPALNVYFSSFDLIGNKRLLDLTNLPEMAMVTLQRVSTLSWFKQERIAKKIYEPYMYYYNGMFSANPEYFNACYKVS